tara:strand:+ start:301 stop:465 length:165 start_codon:yes stop_codon:yes gene_type:complete
MRTILVITAIIAAVIFSTDVADKMMDGHVASASLSFTMLVAALLGSVMTFGKEV